jgi:uncharacterized membrane protein YqjE
VIITVSFTLALGVIVALLVRSTYRLSASAAVICIVFGFMLAQTSFAPMIQQMLDNVTHMISTL